MEENLTTAATETEAAAEPAKEGAKETKKFVIISSFVIFFSIKKI